MSELSDPFDLQRFVMAQEGVYEQVCAELRGGRKEGHWIWFIFPQMRGLGSSAMANAFGIASRAEAAAYLEHAVLGARLRECTRLVNLVEGRSIERIFGYPDDLKFRSSMTLFGMVDSGESLFQSALERFFAGEGDSATLRLIR